MQSTVSKQSKHDVRKTMPVEVVGLQSHLTVPSRYHPQLVDLWFEVSWPQKTERWDDEFAAAMNAISRESAAFGSLSLQPLSQYRGWIVARRVPRDPSAHRAVDACVRNLVNAANERSVKEPSVVPAPRERRPHWTLRTLSLLGGFGAIFTSQAQ